MTAPPPPTNSDGNRFMNKALMRCKGIACDARLGGLADLCGKAAKPGHKETQTQRVTRDDALERT
jgi:hypothetical protein